MNFRFSIRDFRSPKKAIGRGSVIVFVGLLPVGAPAAGEKSSLSESKVETTESVTALLGQNEELRSQLSIQQESIKALTSSLAEANGTAELFRHKYTDLKLRIEALGLESGSKDRAKLEQRLLAAVSDLRLAQKERDEFRGQMLRMNEAILRYVKTTQSDDAQARMGVETQLRAANDLAIKLRSANAESASPNLMDGSVISAKHEWSFVVGNLGAKHGVKIGMPLRVMRGERKIATLRVVDVRHKICGAVIEDSGKEKIKIGDRLQVDANVSLK